MISIPENGFKIEFLIMNKIDIIIQARTGSKRLPRKVLAYLGEKTIFEFLVKKELKK